MKSKKIKSTKKKKKLTASQLRKQKTKRVIKGRKDIKKGKKERSGWKKGDDVLWMHTGSVILNIKCSGGNPDGGYREGRIECVIGGSNAGKTILVLTGLAHVANNPLFDNYRLIFDDAEEADSFDHEALFGEEFSSRVEPPSLDDDGQPQNSETVEMFSDHIHDACDVAENTGKPFIYVLDSLDSIDSDKEIELELSNRKARKEKDLSKIKDSYGGDKQKYLSKFFRQTRTKLKKTRSFLIIICQTRDNLKAFSFKKERVAGGRARKFYTSVECWLTHIKEITKTLNKKKFPIGIETRIKIDKNKFTGKKANVDVSIYPSYGVDDVGSCIDYLLEMKHWKKTGNKIKAVEFDQTLTKPLLTSYIEEKEKRKKREKKLFQLCSDVYLEIEKQLALPRRKKFE